MLQADVGRLVKARQDLIARARSKKSCSDQLTNFRHARTRNLEEYNARFPALTRQEHDRAAMLGSRLGRRWRETRNRPEVAAKDPHQTIVIEGAAYDVRCARDAPGISDSDMRRCTRRCSKVNYDPKPRRNTGTRLVPLIGRRDDEDGTDLDDFNQNPMAQGSLTCHLPATLYDSWWKDETAATESGKDSRDTCIVRIKGTDKPVVAVRIPARDGSDGGTWAFREGGKGGLVNVPRSDILSCTTICPFLAVEIRSADSNKSGVSTRGPPRPRAYACCEPCPEWWQETLRSPDAIVLSPCTVSILSQDSGRLPHNVQVCPVTIPTCVSCKMSVGSRDAVALLSLPQALQAIEAFVKVNCRILQRGQCLFVPSKAFNERHPDNGSSIDGDSETFRPLWFPECLPLVVEDLHALVEVKDGDYCAAPVQVATVSEATVLLTLGSADPAHESWDLAFRVKYMPQGRFGGVETDPNTGNLIMDASLRKMAQDSDIPITALNYFPDAKTRQRMAAELTPEQRNHFVQLGRVIARMGLTNMLNENPANLAPEVPGLHVMGYGGAGSHSVFQYDPSSRCWYGTDRSLPRMDDASMCELLSIPGVCFSAYNNRMQPVRIQRPRKSVTFGENSVSS